MTRIVTSYFLFHGTSMVHSARAAVAGARTIDHTFND
jgi:hypothetical protein